MLKLKCPTVQHSQKQGEPCFCKVKHREERELEKLKQECERHPRQTALPILQCSTTHGWLLASHLECEPGLLAPAIYTTLRLHLPGDTEKVPKQIITNARFRDFSQQKPAIDIVPTPNPRVQKEG